MTSTPRRGRAAAAPAQPAPAVEPDVPAAMRPSAAAFRRASTEGEIYSMPGAGIPARLRRPSLIELATRGQVPNPLAAEVMRLAAADDNPAQLSVSDRIARFKSNARAFIEIAALAFVEPRLILDRAPNYDNGEIGPGDVADRDYLFIYYELVEGDADSVAPFRLDP